MISRALEFLGQSRNMLVPRVPFRTYSRGELWRDLVAGITVATVLIPQSIAYALLAGLPPANGLYAALLGGIGGSLWGASRYLATGPIAIVCLLSAIAVSSLAPVGSAQYVTLIAALALMVGLIQVVFGMSHFGFLVRLVPSSVLVGFSTAAAFVIILTQVPHFLGIPSSSSALAFDQLMHVATHIGSLNIVTLTIGSVAIIAVVVLRMISSKIPGNLIVLVIGIVASIALELSGSGVRLAGEIPAQLPLGDIPSISIAQMLSLLSHAFVIALVGFMSSYATIKEFSEKSGERPNPDQELFAQGMANVLSGLFRGHPVGGSLSRTAVNFSAGAQTAWAGVFASLVLVAVILFFAGFLAQLPTAVLAAILIAAVVPLVDFSELKRMYRISYTDGVIGFVTFGAVFVIRLDQAILLGVVLALVLYMRKVMWVHVIEVGFHPQWLSIVSRATFPEAQTFPHMLILRIDAPIFYANVERLETEIEARIEEYQQEHTKELRVVALDFSGVNHMDVTGVEGFTAVVQNLAKKNIKIYVTTPRREIREVLERGHIAEHVRFIHGTRELRLIGEALKEKGNLVLA